MFCQFCGKPLDDSLKFCPSCGEKTNQTAEINKTEIFTNNSRNTRGTELTHDYANDLKKSFNCFIGYIIAVIKTPTMSLESTNTYLIGKRALVYTGILASIYSIIQCVLSKIIYGGLISMIDSFTSQIPFVLTAGIENQLNNQNPNWLKLFVINFFFIIIFVCILSLLSLAVYALIMKKAVKVMDFVKIYLNSLVLLVIISFIIMIAAAINLKLMLVMSIMGGLFYLTSIIINFVNLLKNETKVIYTLPVIIFLSLFSTYYIYLKMM